MKAITVKYHAATNTRGARLSARADDIPVKYYPWKYADDADNYTAAAREYRDSLGWSGSMVGGHTADGMVFVFRKGPQII